MSPPMITCWSMHQPYAGLVAAGLKTLETRPRPWPAAARPYPSQLLICASQTIDDGAIGRLWDRIPSYRSTRWLCGASALGLALAVADVVGCRLLTAEDEPRSWYWDPEGDARAGVTRWAWELANVFRVAPFKVSGRQGFARSVERSVVDRALEEYAR